MSNKTKMNQHDQRRVAFQTIFLLNQTDNDLTVAGALDQVAQTLELDAELPEYLVFLVQGVADNQAELNEQISSHLKKGWQLSRISNINLAILQLAIFEILHSESIPAVGAVNEALNLTSEFSDDKSKAFINGILSNFIKD